MDPRHTCARRVAPCFSILLLLLMVPSLSAAASASAQDEIHRRAITSWVALHRAEIVSDLSQFLSLPNVSRDREGIRVNIEALRTRLEQRGLSTRLLESGASPYLFARLPVEDPPAGRPALVVLFYCHLDGQPVDPSLWTVTAPFAPHLTGPVSDPETRIYARSASDDKAPIVALLAAIDALRDSGLPPSVEARFIFDPEEERGSPHLHKVLEENRSLLAADLMIFADGPIHPSGRPTALFGTRGIVTITLTVYGPKNPIHSGHYGNWAPNPAEKLAALLASMKAADGRVLIEGFYDDVVPLSPRQRQALEQVPRVEEDLKHRLLIARPDGGGKSLQELINLPSLNLRGIRSGWVGREARTIVPATATAEMDLRLVKGVLPGAQVERFRTHARKQGFLVVDKDPSPAERRQHPLIVKITRGAGTPASRTAMDTPLSRAFIQAVRRASQQEPVLLPTLGGTGPLSLFQAALHLPVYGLPVVNPDNNQHSPDENLRLGHLWDGIVLYASLLRFPAPVP
ncbi:MAG: M20/M25/M40 family metallo-hydrolase [Acidobacteriota bacterium]